MGSDRYSTYTWIGVIREVWSGILTSLFYQRKICRWYSKEIWLGFCSVPLIDMVMCLFQRLLNLCTRRRVPIFFIWLVRNPPSCCCFLFLPLNLFLRWKTGSVSDAVPTPMIGSLWCTVLTWTIFYSPKISFNLLATFLFNSFSSAWDAPLFIPRVFGSTVDFYARSGQQATWPLVYSSCNHQSCTRYLLKN